MPDYLIVIDVHLLLVRDDRVLLSKRRGNYGDGLWHLPAGKVEPGESAPTAAIREAREETGVRIKEEDLRFVHALHARGEGVAPRLGLFFEAREWTGTPTNQEPDKCYELTWFRWNDLPKNMIPYSLAGVHGYLDGKQFGAMGW